MIAIQGQRGSYSHAAAVELYGSNVKILHLNTFEKTFEALRGDKVEGIVVAIANSRFGFTGAYPELTTPDHYDEYWVNDETVLPISHCVIAKEGVTIDDITAITSQYEALGQCNQFIGSLNGRVTTIIAEDTALAAKQVAEGERRDIAAIASAATVSEYPGLQVLQKGVQDDKLNLTRFVSVVRRANARLSGSRPDTTLGKLKLSQQAGSLSRALDVFARHKIGLGFINSQHIPNAPLAVDIILQVEAAYTDQRFKAVIEELAHENAVFRPMGTYKAHELDFDHVAEWHKDALKVAKAVNATRELKAYEALNQQLMSSLTA